MTEEGASSPTQSLFDFCLLSTATTNSPPSEGRRTLAICTSATPYFVSFASSQAGDLMRHLKTHSGEKTNKCNQCDFASARLDVLKIHLKMHSGEKSNKCNQCDYASIQAGDMRRHMKTHNLE